MEGTFAKVEELMGHLREYVDNRIASVKLNVADKSSKVIAVTIALSVAFIFLMLFLVFSGIALAYALEALTGKLYWGFLIVSGIYLLLAILVWTLREKLIRLPILNAMLQNLFKEEPDGKD